MIHETLGGFFDFDDVYDEAIAKYDNAVFIELGVFLGKSTSYLAERLSQVKKNIKFFAIDSFMMNAENEIWWLIQEYGITDLEIQARINLEPLKDWVTVIGSDSSSYAKNFEDGSIDFVYIDAGHKYEACYADIVKWLPKIKMGGLIAGHDIDFPTVKQAVEDTVKTYDVKRRSWMHYITEKFIIE
jgi:predicted O-methyltransferase YrrM